MTLARREQNIAIARAERAEVGHWAFDDIRLLVDTAATSGKRKADRDALLIRTIFDCSGRISEVLTITPASLRQVNGGYVVHFTQTKGGGERDAGISTETAQAIMTYAYNHGIDRHERVFPIKRKMAWRIMNETITAAGLEKPDHVGSVHILRHSGAIHRLKLIRNVRAIQHQLGHRSITTTMEYLKTLERQEGVLENATVDIGW